jgi:hypothetical protein
MLLEVEEKIEGFLGVHIGCENDGTITLTCQTNEQDHQSREHRRSTNNPPGQIWLSRKG